MNLTVEPPALGYRLVPDELHGCGRIEWLGQSEHRAADLLNDPGRDDDRTERDAAAGWLTDYLTESDGEATAKDVKAAAKTAGFSERTLDRARDKAGVTTGRSGFGKGAVYVWRLDLSSTPHARHERHLSEPGEHGEHGGAHAETGRRPH
jgi:hypothetical protein